MLEKQPVNADGGKGRGEGTNCLPLSDRNRVMEEKTKASQEVAA